MLIQKKQRLRPSCSFSVFTRSNLLVLILHWTIVGNIVAQQNPFEIKKRLPEPTSLDTQQVKPLSDSMVTAQLIDSLIPIDSTPLVDISTPSIFDLAPDSQEVFWEPADSTGQGRDSIEEVEVVTTTAPPDQSSHKQNGIINRLNKIEITNGVHLDDRNLLFGISIFSLLLLASLLAVNRSLVRKSYRAIANDNYLRFLYREYKTMPWLYWLFYLHFFINAGFFLYLLIQYFSWYERSSLLVMMACIAFVALVYLTKHLSLSVLAGTFPVDKEAHLYGFVTMLLNILLGLALLPINLLVAFAPLQVVVVTVWVGIGIVIVLYFFRQLKGLFISGRLVNTYLFHFFLYLCTAEIAPLLIVGKLALGNLGVH